MPRRSAQAGESRAKVLALVNVNKKSYAASEIPELVERAAMDAGGSKAWAQRCGISVTYINAVIRGERGVSDRMLTDLGLAEAKTYRRVKPYGFGGKR